MSFEACMAEIRGQFDGALSDDEILEVLEEFNAVARATAEARPWANIQEELYGHAGRLAKEAREAVLIQRRNKALNRVAEANARAMLDKPEFAADPYRAVIALDVGSLGTAQSGRLSVAAKSQALGRRWMGSLINALDKAELSKVVSSGELDAPIAKELWELGRRKGGKPGVSGSKEALQAAKVIHRLQEVMISRLNRSGAFIRRLPGYIVRQSHDPLRIRKAGFTGWFAEASQRVDEFRTWGRFLANDERRDLYGKLYAELQSGSHMKPITEEELSEAAGFKGGMNLAKKRSVHRAVHFKSADDWLSYNKRFGTGGVMELLTGSIVNNARDVSLMETWGTNPEKMHEGFVRLVDERLKTAGKKLADERVVLPPKILYDAISGGMNRPASARLSQRMVFLRSTQVWSKLGSAVISAFSDSPVMAGELKRHGAGVLERTLKPLANLGQHLANDADRRRLANMLGAYSEGVSGDLFGRFDMGDGNQLPGMVSWMNRKFFKVSGLNLWTDAHRSGVALAMSHHMADRVSTAFEQLPDDYRTLLGAYGIDAADWTKIAGTVEDLDGRGHVVPAKLGLDAFGDVATAAGRRGARAARDRLATKLETFFSDRMDAGVLNPGVREKAILLRGTRPGTVEGEFLRAVAQFKSFPAAVLSRVWGERIAASEYGGLAAVILGMTVMGGVSVVTRDTLKGVAPADMSDPQQAGQFFLRAFLQGGGAGILGDFALGEFNRYGRSATATLAGPLLGQVDTLAGLWAAAVRARDSEDATDFAAKALKAAYSNLPGVNLFYARTALDYFLLYSAQEWLNPGYLRRMERQRERDTGQKFMLSPSG
jgi:hypothetical protein